MQTRLYQWVAVNTHAKRLDGRRRDHVVHWLGRRIPIEDFGCGRSSCFLVVGRGGAVYVCVSIVFIRGRNRSAHLVSLAQRGNKACRCVVVNGRRRWVGVGHVVEVVGTLVRGVSHVVHGVERELLRPRRWLARIDAHIVHGVQGQRGARRRCAPEAGGGAHVVHGIGVLFGRFRNVVDVALAAGRQGERRVMTAHVVHVVAAVAACQCVC